MKPIKHSDHTMMKAATLKLTDGRQLGYQIRLSKRAKYMRMTFSARKGLIVTQPVGVCEHILDNWIKTKLSWITQTFDKMEEQLADKPDRNQPLTRPTVIELPAVNQTLQVFYRETSHPQITVDYEDDGTVTLSGATSNPEHCVYVLQKWLQSYAKFHLGTLLQQAAKETGLTYKSYRIKAQRSRWGSCSSLGNINLNYKLLLMPPEWTRYTLIHELCHTVEMNHSKRFWALVQQFVPNYKNIHQEMKQADVYLPTWVNHQIS